MTRTGVMVELSCGHWQREEFRSVNLEEWDKEHREFPSATGFGMGSAPAYRCEKHGKFEACVRRSFWEWHVFCHCKYRAWHGMDAEKARADYERHSTRFPDHEVRVGWDSFSGDVSRGTGQGTLFRTDDELEDERRSDAARLEAVKRHAVASKKRAETHKSRSVRAGVTESNWKPSGSSGRVSFSDLAESARLRASQKRSGGPAN